MAEAMHGVSSERQIEAGFQVDGDLGCREDREREPLRARGFAEEAYAEMEGSDGHQALLALASPLLRLVDRGRPWAAAAGDPSSRLVSSMHTGSDEVRVGTFQGIN